MNISELKVTKNQYTLLQLFKSFLSFENFDRIYKTVYLIQSGSNNEIFNYTYIRTSNFNCFSSQLNFDLRFLIDLRILSEHQSYNERRVYLGSKKENSEVLDLIVLNSHLNSFLNLKEIDKKKFNEFFYHYARVSDYELGDNLLVI